MRRAHLVHIQLTDLVHHHHRNRFRSQDARPTQAATVEQTPRLPQFLSRYPLLSLEIGVSNHREEMMTGVDVAVRFGPTEPSSLVARKLLETRVVTCASPGYLKQHGEPLTPQDLIQHEHEAVLFRDPQTGRPFPWEFHRKGKVLDIQVRGRMLTDDPSTAIAACASGYGLFQSLELGLAPWLQSGKLVRILSEWSDEHYPLYAYYVSRHLPPAKIRAFVDFVQEIVVQDAPGLGAPSNRSGSRSMARRNPKPSG